MGERLEGGRLGLRELQHQGPGLWAEGELRPHIRTASTRTEPVLGCIQVQMTVGLGWEFMRVAGSSNLLGCVP